MLSPHDPTWSSEFAALADIYTDALGAMILGVEHVGSTAVCDLLAKPILDIDVVMSDYSVFDEIVVRLGRIGYQHVGDQGIFQRESFKPIGAAAPNVSRPGGWMRHHLYVCPIYGRELQRHVRFRDALRQRPELRREYESLKVSIASRAGGVMERYAEIKEQVCRPFVECVLRLDPGES